MFPTGMVWDGEKYGTDETTSVFSWLGEFSNAKDGMASLAPASWNQVAAWLQQIDELRCAA